MIPKKLYIVNRDLVLKECKVIARSNERDDHLLVQLPDGSYEKIFLRTTDTYYYSNFRDSGPTYISRKPISMDDPRLDKLKLADRESFILKKLDTGIWILERGSESEKLRGYSYEDLRLRVFVFRTPEKLINFLTKETTLYQGIVRKVSESLEEACERVKDPKFVFTKDEEEFLGSEHKGLLEADHDYLMTEFHGSVNKMIHVKEVIDKGTYILSDGTYITHVGQTFYDLPPKEGVRSPIYLQGLKRRKQEANFTLDYWKKEARGLKKFFDNPMKNSPSPVRIFDQKAMERAKRHYNYRVIID